MSSAIGGDCSRVYLLTKPWRSSSVVTIAAIKLSASRMKKTILVICGILAVVLGIAGIFLPLLPTTPFLLVAAACYVRSSERLYKWLTTNRWTGSYIQTYQKGTGLPLRAKILTVAILWGTVGWSTYLIGHRLIFLIQFFFAILTTILILRLPTQQPGNPTKEPKKD